MAEPVTVGIAGLGRSGWKMHAAALERLPEHYRVEAVMDPDPARCAEAERRFNCQSFDTYAELTQADVELICVATPSPFHLEQTLAALEQGKHVIVEKPLAGSVAAVDQMIAAAKKAGKRLTVNQNYRYHNYFKTMTEVMASGKLGEVLQIRIAIHQFSRRWDWQTSRQHNGGILTNHGAHVLDWLLLHFEDDDPEVFCHLADTPLYAGDADSHAKVIIRPKDGPLLDVELTHANAYPQDNFLILGTQGTLTGDRNRLRWKYFVPENEKALVLELGPAPDRSYNAETLTFVEEAVDLEDSFKNDVVQVYQDLYSTLREGKPLAITPESVRRQIDLFNKCYQSARW